MENKYLIEPLRERCYYISEGEFISYFDSRLLVFDPADLVFKGEGEGAAAYPYIYNIVACGTIIHEMDFFKGEGSFIFKAFDFTNDPIVRSKALLAAFNNCLETEEEENEDLDFWVNRSLYSLQSMGLQDAPDFKKEMEAIIIDAVASDSTLRKYVKL